MVIDPVGLKVRSRDRTSGESRSGRREAAGDQNAAVEEQRIV